MTTPTEPTQAQLAAVLAQAVIDGTATDRQKRELAAWLRADARIHPYNPPGVFCAPGDEQEPVFLVRFADQDVHEQIWTGEDAEVQAWESWDRHSPSWNLWMFRLVRLDERPIAVPSIGEAVNTEYMANLVETLRVAAESHKGSPWATNFGGELRGLRFLLDVAANQIERLAATAGPSHDQ